MKNLTTTVFQFFFQSFLQNFNTRVNLANTLVQTGKCLKPWEKEKKMKVYAYFDQFR